MTDPAYGRVREIFHEVAELEGDALASRLAELCEGDDALRAEVERLIDASARAGMVTEAITPVGGLFGDAQGAPTIDGFLVARLLGEGGMGAVYEAEQEEPRRRVALKVIRAGYASEGMLRRFRREAEALARLQHPAIAQVYEVGVGEVNGRSIPYLAMELVEGEPLTRFAVSRDLDRREKLELARKICEGVEHAHRRGVVHRDLKPANILVDEHAQPKILDFGIARMTESDVHATTMRTEAGQILGTAAYMSPEQASGDPTRVDTRSDVYSLGVVIFELLSGRLPHVVDRLPLPDAIRMIREDDPTRLGTIHSGFRGDLETILAKALERERDRRYQSASEFGDDIGRFLRDEPIVARPPSAAYQLQKFARRNRMLVGGVVAVMLALAIGLAATSVALSREARARVEAEEALQRADASAAFLERIFVGLDPKTTQGRDTELLRDMLDEAAASLGDEVEHPVVRAEMLVLIGDTYKAIFEQDRAAEALSEAVALREELGLASEPEHDDVLLSLGAMKKQSGDLDGAEVILLDVVGRVEGESDSRAVDGLLQLVELETERGRFEEAYAYLERARPLAERLPAVRRAQVAFQQGAVMRRMMRLDEAEASYERARELFMEDGALIEAAGALNGLAILARMEDRPDDAERYYREAIELRESVDARPNPAIATQLSNLGRLLSNKGRFDEAEPLLERSLAMTEELFGEDDYRTGFVTSSLALLYSKTGRHEESLDAFEHALKVFEAQFGERHPYLVVTLADQGDALRKAGRYVESAASSERSIELSGELGLDPRIYERGAWFGLGETYLAMGDRERALECFEQSLEYSLHIESVAGEVRARIEDVRAGGS